MTEIIANLADLGTRYDAVFCDLWGCLHNGKTPFPVPSRPCKAFAPAAARSCF